MGVGFLNREEEARATENAVVTRIARAMDTPMYLHGDDPDHSGTASSIRGTLPTHRDFAAKFGETVNDPTLKLALGRINHPLFPYPKAN